MDPQPAAQAALEAPPQPQLLLGLPQLAQDIMVSALSSGAKTALLRTCKEARQAVLHHALKIRFDIDDIVPRKQSTSGLSALLAARTTPLHLELKLGATSDTATTQLLKQLATQRYPGTSGHSCVRELTISKFMMNQVVWLCTCRTQHAKQ